MSKAPEAVLGCGVAGRPRVGVGAPLRLRGSGHTAGISAGCRPHSSFQRYLTCPLQYAFQYVYRILGDETKGHFEFGTAVHSAFEAFAIARRDARAAGAPDPGYEVLKSGFDALWQPTAYGDAQQAEHYLTRSEPA
ncbi:MAG: PD-(D/E)XK nuclease family protein, partial [Chloroflexi bacterium]|nr:PD-(D/E)XK nuclease family protein [Chloroflexota bacterium]